MKLATFFSSSTTRMRMPEGRTGSVTARIAERAVALRSLAGAAGGMRAAPDRVRISPSPRAPRGDVSSTARRPSFCRRLTGNVWDAEDLVQDTLLRAFGTLGSVHVRIENPRAYLLRTATDLRIDTVRRRESEATALAEPGDGGTDPAAPGDRPRRGNGPAAVPRTPGASSRRPEGALRLPPGGDR